MKRTLVGVLALSVSSFVALPPAMAQSVKSHTVTLTFGANLVTKNVYENGIFPAFEKYWKQRAGYSVKFQASFENSATMATDVASGLPIDIVALSTDDDMLKLQKSGYITSSWDNGPFHGIVSESVVAFGVRKGNPDHIKNWTDLEKKGLTVDLGNPVTSGGCKWFTDAMYAAALRSHASAKKLMAGIYHNVQTLGSSADESMSTFTSGTGDVVINYQNEILDASHHLKSFSEVIPNQTMLIENPIAVVDKDVARDGNTAVAKAFVTFVQSVQAQKIFAQYGYRPIRQSLAQQFDQKYKIPNHLAIVSSLGGWTQLDTLLYGPKGLWMQVVEGQ